MDLRPSSDAHDPVIQYAYDYLGTRVSRSALDSGDDPDPDETRYLVDYENLTGYSQTLAEVGEDDQPLREYIYGQDHGALAQTTGPVPDFFHGDHLGTTRQLTDGLGRARLAAGPAGYTPFGEATSGDLGSLTSLAFTGQFRETATALQYHRARWLNTAQGRWLSEDPVWDFPENLGSIFGYGNQLLIQVADPSGESLVEQVIITGLIGGLTAVAYDSYVNGWTSLGHALTVAAIGALAAIVVLLLFLGITALVGWGLGLTMAEAGLVVGILAAPLAIGSAGKAYADAKHPREKNAALAFLVVSIGFAVVGPAAGHANQQYYDNLQRQQSLRTLEMGRMLQSAVRNKGNSGIGTATAEEAQLMGEAWVGTGYKITSNGETGKDQVTILISSNGQRQFREPSWKPRQTKWQANFESREINPLTGQASGKWQNNAHLEIKDP